MNISKFTTNIATILQGIKGKSSKVASSTVDTITKATDNNKTQQKISDSLEALSLLGKSQLNLTSAPYMQPSETMKLVNESIKEGLTPEQAIRGAQEVLAATGRQNIPKSAAESARFFMLNEKSNIEHKMDIEDLLKALNNGQTYSI